MGDFVECVCPFCHERDFDAAGLKTHLMNGWCDKFNEVGEHPTDAADGGEAGRP